MATIAEIREKYPQYADMPDAALADALHSKFYADIPKSDFYAKVGLTSPSAAAPSEGMPSERKMSTGEAFMQAPMGIYRGFKDVTDTMLKGGASALDYVAGTNTRQAMDEAAARQAREYEQTYGNSAIAGTGRVAGNIAATAPVGGLVAAPIRAAGAVAPGVARITAPLAESVASGGFRTGLPAGAADVAARAAGGAVSGATAAGLINPEDTGTGAAIGAVVPTAGAAVVKKIAQGLGWGKDLVSGRLPEIKAATIARTALGDALPDALAVLKSAPSGITPAQALQRAGINADPFMALEAFAKKNDTSSWYRLLSEGQETGMSNRLAAMAGGANQTTARQSAQGSINALNANLVPEGQAALERANVGGTITKALNPELASLGAGAQGRPLSVAPALSQTQGQLDALAAAGLKPIDTSAIVNNIQGKLADPKIGPSDVNSSVLNKVISKIQDWTAKGGGVIDAEALYTIRKNAVNEEVQRLMGASAPTAQAKYAAKLLEEVNPLIDNAIETAGGKGWKQYLSDYAAGRQKVEQKQMAAQIKDMFDKGQKQQVIDLIRGNNPDAVESVFGPGSFNVFSEMAPRMPQLSKIANRLEGDIKIGEQAAAGVGGLARAMGMSQAEFKRIPAFFSKTTTALNMALDVLEGHVGRKTLQVFEDGFKSGKNIAELLQTLPSSERSVILSTLKNHREWNPKITTGAAQINSLAPENRNSLRQQ